MAEKPFKGSMQAWTRKWFDKNSPAYKALYGDEDMGIGFIVLGVFIDHPQFGYSPGSRTSWVVSESAPDADGNRMIETRKSRYKLIGEGGDIDKPE